MYVLEKCRGLNGEIPLLVMHYRLTSNSNVFFVSTVVENLSDDNCCFQFRAQFIKIARKTCQITTFLSSVHIQGISWQSEQSNLALLRI